MLAACSTKLQSRSERIRGHGCETLCFSVAAKGLKERANTGKSGRVARRLGMVRLCHAFKMLLSSLLHSS